MGFIRLHEVETEAYSKKVTREIPRRQTLLNILLASWTFLFLFEHASILTHGPATPACNTYVDST